MNGVYSVLRQSIIDRNLRSPAARKEAYSQARTAVIRQLWTYDPPLNESDIEARVKEFDESVAEIEDELSRLFAKVREAPKAPPSRSRQTAKDVAVYEGYDQASDYTPAVAPRGRGRGSDDRRNSHTPERSPRDPYPDHPSLEAIEEALAARSAALEETARMGGEMPPTAEDQDYEEDDARTEPEAPYDTDLGVSEDFEARLQGEIDAAEDNDHSVNGLPYEFEAGDRRYSDEEIDREFDRDNGAAGEERGHGSLGTRRAPMVTLARWHGLPERHRIMVLLAAIGLLILALAGAAAFLLTRTQNADSTPPPTADNAAATPQDSGSGFVVFDGRDRSMFQSSPGNPVAFGKDSGGGFARISSSASDAGVRVLIAPDVANKFAGRNIRLTLVARAAHDAGASDLRFAYQSGVALSHWQTTNLSAQYAPVTLTWRVPVQRTDPNGDYILIEPGIPGDGTRADVKSIRIDLAS